MTSSQPEKPKPGPKGKVLEPYAKEILLKAREGRSMQDIVNWLAESPRNVAITRQAVHQWLKARIRKLVKLNDAFAGTGVSPPFQGDAAVATAPPTQSANVPAQAQAPPALPSASATTPRKRTDMNDFMVSEADLNRAENPFLRKP